MMRQAFLFLLPLLVLLTVPIVAVVASTVPSSASSSEVDEEQDIQRRDDDDDDDDASSSSLLPEYLIVGAGGSGIQMALFLQKYNHTYTILERESVPGSFWTKFPIFDELISVNKWVRNETQRLRYDWHSMLESPWSMLDVTDDYFPTKDAWHTYMTEVVKRARIDIEYNVQVERISDSSDGNGNGNDDNKHHPCVVLTDGTQRCALRRIFLGTGLVEKPEPFLQAFGGIPYSQITTSHTKRRRVCILGNGNTGFEIAQNVYGSADRVTIYGRDSHRLSAVTRYTGDVRVKYLQVLENLHGKLLDTVEKYDYSFKLRGLEGFLNDTQIDVVNDLIRAVTFLMQFDCETFVLATGFESNVPGWDPNTNVEGEGISSQQQKFPPMTDWYQSSSNPNVHYIGWLMHRFDFRKGAGGFLSGFRYLIRNLVHRVREIDHGVPYPYVTLRTKEEVVRHAMDRIQIASDLIILQDGVVLRDMIVPCPECDDSDGGEGGGGSNNNEDNEVYRYYEGVTYQFHPERTRDDAIYLYFTWGDGRTVENVFDNVLRYSDTNALINLFLHPVVEIGNTGLTREMMEDLNQAWNSEGYEPSMDKTIRAALNGDLTLFRPKRTFEYSRSVVNEKEPPGYFEEAKAKGNIDPDLIDALWKAVRAGGVGEEMDVLRNVSKRVFPALFEVKDALLSNDEKKENGALEDLACGGGGSLDSVCSEASKLS